MLFSQLLKLFWSFYTEGFFQMLHQLNKQKYNPLNTLYFYPSIKIENSVFSPSSNIINSLSFFLKYPRRAVKL